MNIARKAAEYAKDLEGEAFFDAMDTALDCESIYQQLYDLILDPFRYTFVLSGRFGMHFYKWVMKAGLPHAGAIIFPGGLRDGKSKAPITLKVTDRWTQKACFIDDSFYSGTTRATCLHVLYVPKDLPTFIAYDGSVEKQQWVTALYRWHTEQEE